MNTYPMRLLGPLLGLLLLAACGRGPLSTPAESGDAGPVIDAGGSATTTYGGYTSKVSVAQGESLDFHLSSDTGDTASLRIYREGAARQLMTTLTDVPVGHYHCDGGYATGCGWPAATTFTVPGDWPSGVYIAVYSAAGAARSREIIFWVREDAPGSSARLLFLSSVNTHQAYNEFGGGSLYGFDDNVKSQRVSFNRPYIGGTGKYARWEAPAISWLESSGYTAEYAATYDLHFQPGLLSHYDVAMIVGHSEYWTWEMRRAVEQFIDNGGRFLSLTGNTMWWQVRYEDDGRTMVGYKNWHDDPEKAPELSTDNPGQYPILDNPLGLIGLYWPYGGYPGEGGDGYYAANTDHWVFAGTGVAENQLIGDGPGVESSLHDKESDGMPFNCAADGATLLGPPGSAGTPPNFTPLGITTVSSHIRGIDSFALMGITTRPGGGALFAAGTTGWAGALWDPTIDRMTRNLLDRFLAGDVPAEPANPDGAAYVANRFNCYDLGRGRSTLPAWQTDVARYNFAAWQGTATTRLSPSCGVDGAGLEFKPGGGNGSSRLIANLRPNWAAVESLAARFYLRLDDLALSDGKSFTLVQQSADNHEGEPAAALALQLRRAGAAWQMRYGPPNVEMPWLDVPAAGFFLVETEWDRAAGRVALRVDGAGYDQAAGAALPALNRFDLGVIKPSGSVGGFYCLDELILTDRPQQPTPTATPSPTPTDLPPTPTPTATASPTATATAPPTATVEPPTTTPSPSPTPPKPTEPPPTTEATPSTATPESPPTVTPTATAPSRVTTYTLFLPLVRR